MPCVQLRWGVSLHINMCKHASAQFLSTRLVSTRISNPSARVPCISSPAQWHFSRSDIRRLLMSKEPKMWPSWVCFMLIAECKPHFDVNLPVSINLCLQVVNIVIDFIGIIDHTHGVRISQRVAWRVCTSLKTFPSLPYRKWNMSSAGSISGITARAHALS